MQCTILIFKAHLRHIAIFIISSCGSDGGSASGSDGGKGVLCVYAWV